MPQRAPAPAAAAAAANKARVKEEQKARAKEDKDRLKAQKAEEKERLREQKQAEKDSAAEAKVLYNFATMERVYTLVMQYQPKGGPTQKAWSKVADGLNAGASALHVGKYTAKNAYEAWLRWAAKPAPTGNPALGDDDELALMVKIKMIEVAGIVGASAPEDGAVPPTCQACKREVRGAARLYYWARAFEREFGGEQFYRPGSHMPLTKNEMLHWQRHTDALDLKCMACVSAHSGA